MKIVPKLTFCDSPQRPATAWLVLGQTAMEWIAEMASWGVPLHGVAIHPLSHAGGGTIGALVRGDFHPGSLRVGRAVAYGQLASHVLAPVDAACDPPLDEDALERLFPNQYLLLVWHPVFGVFRVGEDALRAADLLQPPERIHRDWAAARTGIAVNERLYSLHPLVIPTLDQVLAQGRDGIGLQSGAGHKMPPAPGEPIAGELGRVISRAGLNGMDAVAGAIAAGAGLVTASGAALLGGIAGGLAAAGLTAEAGMLAAGAAGVTGALAGGFIAKSACSGSGAKNQNHVSQDSWVGRIAKWAQNRRQKIEKRLEFLRHRQIERLLSLLAKSPDEGLRFALPLAPGNHRGLADPGWRLAERDVGFSLHRLFGGEPIDMWNLTSVHQLRLTEQYRALANREISLGRYRRAAYILAELLGDIAGAAAALAAGGHFREAAVLYDERLHQPQAAARCLEQGGLLTEAIALYERIDQWESAGDLYGKIGQPADAENAYRKAVAVHLAKKDHLAAAQLLEHKVNAADEAYDVLCDGWPDSPVARKCLDASFDFLKRHQRHELAIARIGQLTADRSTAAQHLAGALAELAAGYPNEQVRVAAADTTRRIVSRWLEGAGSIETRALLGSLARLVPGDRLLARDCERFERGRSEQRPTVPLAKGRHAKVSVVNIFRLLPAEWSVAASVGDHFYAAGWLEKGLVCLRTRWDGRMQMPAPGPFIVPASFRSRPILLAVDPRGIAPVYLHVAGTSYAVPPARFAATDDFDFAVSLRAHSACDGSTVLLQYGSGGTVLTGKLTSDGVDGLACEISPYLDDRILPGLQIIPVLKNDGPLSFFVRGDDLFLARGRTLVSKRDHHITADLPTDIHAITASPIHTRPRIIVGCEQGGVVLWGRTADAPRTAFATDFAQPAVGINRGGWIVAATADVIEFYSSHDGKLAFVAELKGPRSLPIAVLSTDDAERIAIVTTDGKVIVYQVRA